VLKLVKSASLGGLHRLFLIAGISNGLLARLFCILVLIFVLFLFLIFLYLFGRACTIFRARHRDAFGFEGLLDLWKLFEERGELLDVE
jgi:hypothetical protein